MAKAGKVETITENTSSFDGTAVEGQKSFDENTSYVVTIRDSVLKKIYFRDGKEIGSEDV